MDHDMVVAAAPSKSGAAEVSLPTTPLPPPPSTSLAPGFRFHPTDEELVQYYLKRKVCGKPFRFSVISEVDVYKSEPQNLQGHSSLKTRDLEWYFFSPVDRKYGIGSRLNRTTGLGYWKTTGKDRAVLHKGKIIGMRKTLVFYGGRAPHGKRTNWVMHEYRLADAELVKAGIAQDAFVLCRIFLKNNIGPPVGDRYAPFVEEEWRDDEVLLVPGEAEDDVANGEYAREGNDLEQDANLDYKPPCNNGELSLSVVCVREKLENGSQQCVADPKHASLNKKSKHCDPNSGCANGSKDSTTSQEPTTSCSSALLQLPLSDSCEPKGNPHASPPPLDSSNLEKSVPPAYLKVISDLETEVLNVSMEKETLKIELTRAQAMIDSLLSRIDLLKKENEDLIAEGV